MPVIFQRNERNETRAERKITVAIVDDHLLVRQLWLKLFQGLPAYKVVIESGNLKEALELIRASRPQIVFLDINIPPHSGFEAIPFIRKFCPGTKIIAISMHGELSYILQMMRLGVDAYVTKNSSHEEVFEAIREVMENRTFLRSDCKNKVADYYTSADTRQAWFTLSTRELEVIKLLTKGFSSQKIAGQLFISRQTVDVHRRNVLRKLKLKNTLALVNFVISNGLMPLCSGTENLPSL